MAPVDGRAVLQQSVGECGTTVVGERAEHGVDTGEGVVRCAEAAASIRVEVVATVGGGCSGAIASRRAVGHDRVLEHSPVTKGVYATAAHAAVSAIAGDGGVGHR